MEKVIDIRPIKKKMRAEAKESRLSMEPQIKSSFDKKICNKLLNLWAVRETETFLCYVSTDIEVDTKEFINALLSAGKNASKANLLVESPDKVNAVTHAAAPGSDVTSIPDS